jgi:hypothetical protein
MKSTTGISSVTFSGLVLFELEGILESILMLTLTYKTGGPLWLPIALFPIFDSAMVGYAINQKIGARLYNIGHSSILPMLLLIIGLLAEYRNLRLFCYAWIFHIGIDRALGYGLKHHTSFRHTHLGTIGK